RDAELAGRPANWRASHNSYTEVSSETGIPGLLLYMAAIWASFRNAWAIRKRGAADPTGVASALGITLLISLVGVCVNEAFSSIAYLAFLPLLMGLSVAFRAAVEREIAPAPIPAKQNFSVIPGMPRPNVMNPASAPAAPVYRFLGRSGRTQS